MLEPLPRPSYLSGAPRANLVAIAGELCTPAIWMGGAHTERGNEIRLEGMSSSWVIDCAGDMPGEYREQAGRWLVRVFADIDAVPSGLPAIRDMVREAAAAMAAGATEAPENVYVVCQHGMNRSGLVAGLLLRELGVSGAEAVERIRRARPGALSNEIFRRLVLEG